MLEEQKEAVCRIAKLAQQKDLCKHKSGNFSIRDKKTGLVAITPTAVDRELLKPEDIVIINMNAEIIENKTGYKPTSESLMHLKIYETREDVNAIAHTHSMYATSFAVLNKPIPAVVYEIANLGVSKARVPVAKYARPGTQELADNVVEACKESDSFLLEKHGVVALDNKTLDEAFLKVSYIEELAQIYYNCLTINQGEEPDSFTQVELDKWKYPDKIKTSV